jgi:hypothetical protein
LESTSGDPESNSSWQEKGVLDRYTSHLNGDGIVSDREKFAAVMELIGKHLGVVGQKVVEGAKDIIIALRLLTERLRPSW